MPIFDTHAHYDSGAFNADRHEVLSALTAEGVGLVVNPGCDVESSRVAVSLAEQHSHVYAAVGIHPGDCADVGEADFAAIRELAKHEKVVAIGEIGLDYYWEKDLEKISKVVIDEHILKDIKKNEIYEKQKELEKLKNKFQELRRKHVSTKLSAVIGMEKVGRLVVTELDTDRTHQHLIFVLIMHFSL